MIKPIHTDNFTFDGRGPELRETFWIRRGATLSGLEYANSAKFENDTSTWHIRFLKPQAAMVTPEEVISDLQLGEEFFQVRGAAMFDCGKSQWLQSFNQRHLESCSHYKMLFYDELVDVICEGVELGNGSFPGSVARRITIP